MPCPLCGDICRCSSVANSAASPRWLPDADASAAVPAQHTEEETPEAEAHSLSSGLSPAEESSMPADNGLASEDSPAWRQEVAVRLNRYQARRKPRPPRYPSLRLHFEQEDSAPAVSSSSVESTGFPQRTAASNQALALDSFSDSATHAVEIPESFPPLAPQVQASREIDAFRRADVLPQQTIPTTAQVTAQPTAKIIEFPRSWTPAPAPLDELAEPVMNRPRILEAPEVVPPPPALGGITIESAQQPEIERRPGIDIPLQSAPLARRIFSAAIDGVIIAAAGVLFGSIFWKLTAIRPPRFQIMGLAAGISALFWGAYQYLLLVYSGSTPGLRLARLELARFDGSHAGRRLRRWRVLASFLSAASLGMGYAWVFLDEDALCWHDRITHTYLAPKSR
jgi:uncharacterized RDD family membrane protein YckC